MPCNKLHAQIRILTELYNNCVRFLQMTAEHINGSPGKWWHFMDFIKVLECISLDSKFELYCIWNNSIIEYGSILYVGELT